MRRVVFKNNKGEELVGELHQHGSKSLIIICQGLKSVRGRPSDRKILEMYFKAGFDMFNFDPSGTGESEGKIGVRMSQRVSEVLTAINLFKDDYREIILMGGSMGALTAAIASLKSDAVKKLITVNGFFYFDRLPLKTKFQLKIHFQLNKYEKENSRYSSAELIHGKIKVPTIVTYVANDKLVGDKQSLEFYKKLVCRKYLILMEYNDHYLTNLEALEEPTKQVIKILERKFKT